MKRITALMLALFMILSLCACGDDSSEKQPETSPATEQGPDDVKPTEELKSGYSDYADLAADYIKFRYDDHSAKRICDMQHPALAEAAAANNGCKSVEEFAEYAQKECDEVIANAEQLCGCEWSNIKYNAVQDYFEEETQIESAEEFIASQFGVSVDIQRMVYIDYTVSFENSTDGTKGSSGEQLTLVQIDGAWYLYGWDNV